MSKVGVVQDHTTIMGIRADVLGGMLEVVREEAPEAGALLELALPQVPLEIPAIHFTEAQRLIAAGTGEDLAGQPALAPAHERRLGDGARQTHGAEFLFVVGYPTVKRPVYTHLQPDRLDEIGPRTGCLPSRWNCQEDPVMLLQARMAPKGGSQVRRGL